MQRRTKHYGFTLLEISMVLIIVGLIIGGVLVGRDMIAAAEIRAQITQIEKYKMAALIFKNKYGALPGDLAGAAGLGLAQAVGVANEYGAASRTGDGLIMSCINDSQSATVAPPYGYVFFGCENSLFWNHLSQTDLIGAGFAQTDNANSFNHSVSHPSLYIPHAVIGDNYVIVYAWNGTNYFHIVGMPTIWSNNGYGSIPSQNRLTPLQAYQLDLKIDNGFPLTGSVKAYDLDASNNLWLYLAAGSNTRCRNSSDAYNVNGSVSDNGLCQLQIKAGF